MRDDSGFKRLGLANVSRRLPVDNDKQTILAYIYALNEQKQNLFVYSRYSSQNSKNAQARLEEERLPEGPQRIARFLCQNAFYFVPTRRRCQLVSVTFMS